MPPLPPARGLPPATLTLSDSVPSDSGNDELPHAASADKPSKPAHASAARIELVVM
jgi:hypothetical protein